MIILLVGKAGSGKSTVANHLTTKYGFSCFKFANILKSMTKHFLRKIGFSLEDSIYLTNDSEGKEKSLKNLERFGIKITSREIQKTIGTEWGRNCIDENLWAKLTANSVLNCSSKFIVVDDCRFINEAQTFRDIFGNRVKIIKIHRSSQVSTDNHQSEKEMDFINCDLTIYNNRSIEYLRREIDILMEKELNEK